MPPKQKNTDAQAGLGENQQAEVSVDHVSMHTEGSESFEEVRQPDNKDIVVAIRNLQPSQVSIWEEIQSLRQRIATPQTLQGGQGPQEEIERSHLEPPLNQGVPTQPKGPQASPYLTREDIAAIFLEARKAKSSDTNTVTTQIHGT